MGRATTTIEHIQTPDAAVEDTRKLHIRLKWHFDHFMYCRAGRTTSSPFHWIALCLHSWRSWRFVKIFKIAVEATEAAKIRDLYASNTLLIRSCYAGHDAAAVLLRFCCTWGPTRRSPRRFYYAATTAKDFKLRLIYDYDDAIATVRRPKCRSSADTALMLRFGTASI